MHLILPKNMFHIIRNIYICFIILAACYEVAFGAVREDGHWGLQDLSDSKAAFLGMSIDALHKDLLEVENAMQKQANDRGIERTINLVVGKFTLFLVDGRIIPIPLKDLIGEALPLIFDSSFSKGDVTEFLGPKEGEDPIGRIDSERAYLQTLMKGALSPADAEFEHAVPNTKEGEKFIKSREDAAKDISQTFQQKEALLKDVECAARTLSTNIESGALEILHKALESKARALKNMVRALTKKWSQYVFGCCHSEPRSLLFLQRVLGDGRVFVDDDGYLHINRVRKDDLGPVSISSVLLDLHSTRNVCNNCRLQFVGASHRWLYNKVAEVLRTESFHTVVTWEHEYEKTTYRKGGDSLDLGGLATIESLGEDFSEHTPPFVSFVQLPSIA